MILEGNGPRVIAIDTGIKDSIVRNLRERGVHLELHPCTITAEELLARKPDAVFLANGPGDPAALDYVVDAVRGVVGKTPVWGICLGHQLLCRAVGLDTYKLPFGHRGANHPVKDLETGRIEITSQNHGFAVLGPGGQRTIDTDEPVRWETDFGVAELQQLNLYDRTVEGLVLRDVPGLDGAVPPRGRAPARTTPCTSSTASWSASLPRRDDIRRILIIGSGPIVIGQAAEFDYSGAQACKVLLEEGYEVILVNSNPATIMTDPEFATRTYIEPLNAGVGDEGDRAREARRAAAHARRRHGARPRPRALRGRHARQAPRGADRRRLRGDPARRGPRAVPRDDGARRPAGAAQRGGQVDARGRAGAARGGPAGDRAARLHDGRRRRRRSRGTRPSTARWSPRGSPPARSGRCSWRSR